MTVTTGRPGGGRARGTASRRGLHLVRPVDDATACGSGGAGVTARDSRSPGRCADEVVAVVEPTVIHRDTDTVDDRGLGGGTRSGRATGSGAATRSGPATRSGAVTGAGRVAGLGAVGTAAERAALAEEGGYAPWVTPAGGPHAAEIDLVQELEGQVLVLRADGPTTTHRAALADLLVAWAESLVALHRSPAPSEAPAVPLPWVLVPDLLAGRPDGSHAVAGRAWAVRQHPRVRRALAAATASWAADRWVHDAGPDAVVVLRGRAAEGLGRELDPERAGLRESPRAELVAAGRGDARWDVATALDWLAVHLTPALDPAWDLDPVAGFMRAYRARGGDAEPDRPLAVARTVATAAAWSDALDARAQEADADELAWVAGLWARPLALLAPR